MNENLFTYKEERKIQKAIYKLDVHISAFETFEEFEPYFKNIVKTDNKEMLNNLFLQMLFYLLKTNKKSDWDILLQSVEESKKKELEAWLKNSLNKL